VSIRVKIWLLALACVAGSPLKGQVHPNPPNRVFEVHSVQHDRSGRLDQMVGVHVPPRQRPFLPIDVPVPSPNAQPDTVLQTSTAPAQLTSSGSGFDGVGNGFDGYVVQVAPPDPNLALSANYIVQWANTSLAIFDRTQNNALVLLETGNTIWSGVGGPCETTNDGDPIVQYDRQDDRWVFTQLANTQGPTYYQCFAVSISNDPRGPYNRYAWTFSDLNDYPKLGVWSDAFYASYNMFLPFLGNYFFQGSMVCGYDKKAMIQGASSATAQCSQLSSSYGSLLPADLDGSALPPAGAPGLFVNYGSNSLNLWKLHVDFSNVNNATLTGPINLPVAAFSAACSGRTCIPQPGTAQQLDSLADRLMYRLAYRNFGDHDALVVNHSVVAGSSTGIRWYEIRNPNTSPAVYQQGTFAPDANYRWMGSIAMDKAGDVAVGYSVSNGSNLFPSIAYTGRLNADALGTMQAETVMLYGSGSQAGTAALSRWGDYTAMRIDPADDCTFWYTNQYLEATGTFNWSTRIGSFSFPSCVSPTSDFTLTASPSSQTVTQGTGTSYSVSYSPSNGYSGTVTLSTSTLPAGVNATFNPTTITVGTSSTMTVGTASNTTTGTYNLTVAGTDTSNASLTHSTAVQLTVNPTLVSVSLNPSTLIGGSSSTGTITLSGAATLAGAVVSLASSNPVVASVPASVTVPAGLSSASFTVTTSSVASSTMITISAAYAGGQTQQAVLTVNPGPSFTLSGSPSSLSIARGSRGNSTVTVTPANGFSSSVTFSASGLPSRTSASFNPNPSATSTATTISAGPKAPTGTYNITVKGSGGGVSASTTLTLTIH
jgi:hypothetical protein